MAERRFFSLMRERSCSRKTGKFMPGRRQSDWEKLEKRDWELWVLALAMIFVLAIGILVAALPGVVTDPTLVGTTLKRVLIGFCVLTALFNAYLIERQFAIKALRRKLFEDQARIALLQLQASENILLSLPREEQFRDRLAMELKRAEHSGAPLSVLTTKIEISGPVEAAERVQWIGEAVKLIMQSLRKEDSVYQYDENLYCMVLPGTGMEAAQKVSTRLLRIFDTHPELHQQGVSLKTYLTNYPKDTESAYELEQLAVQAFLG